MTPHFSAYLDFVRFVSAVLVFLSHLGHSQLVGGVLWPFTAFGNEAVMVFFVLSGFIIAFVTEQREKTLQDYATARLARLYSVIVPAMLLTLVLDWAGTSVDADSYVRIRAFSEGGSATAYLLSFLMLNQSWDLSVHFGSNGAYWSVPYEFWYYAIFGAWFFLTGAARAIALVLAVLLAGPKILVLMPVWLLGVAVFLLRHRARPAWLDALLAVGSVLLLGAMLVADAKSQGKLSFLGMQPNGVVWQYVVGICIALHLFGVSRYTGLLAGIFQAIDRPLKWAAASTFALYLFHLPILGFLGAVLDPRDATSKLLFIVVPSAVALTLGHLCEAQKKSLRAGIGRVIMGTRSAAGLRP